MALGAALFALGFDAFGVPGGTKKHDNHGKLHPDHETDDRGQASVHDAIWHASHIETEAHVDEPPKRRRYHGPRQDLTKAFRARPRHTVYCRKAQHRKEES